MQLNIKLNIPSWTRWVVISGVLGIVLGAGGARVYADQVTVSTVWKDGDLLTAASLNKNFDELENALNRVKHPDCPEDYAKDASSPTGTVVCKNGVDEVVKVGSGGVAFWIDRYEAGVFADINATGTQYGLANAAEFPPSFPENGEYTAPLYAVSVTGKRPSTYLTWFQAQAACRSSGKRLPTGEEWLAAATGTPDPGEHPGDGGFCVTKNTGPRNTGEGTACKSAWGAQDLIGNVWEWTADWYAAPAASGTTPTATWPRDAYKGDGTWNIASQAYNGTVSQVGLPAASFRGGAAGSGVQSGRFALALNYAPSASHFAIGFRCVVPR